MITRTLKTLVLTLVAGLALAAPSYADRTAQVGIEDGQVLLAPRGDSAQIVSRWKAMGVDIVRIQAYWNAISPSPNATSRPAGFNVANHTDPRYNWGSLDNAVNLVRNNGMQVLLTIHQYGPVWASSQPSRRRQGYKPRPALFAQWASAVARRYGSRVTYYEDGNEPNQGVFLSPQQNRSAAHQYRDLVNASYPAIKRVDRNSRVLIGALAPIGAVGRNAGNLAPLPFIRAMHCRDDRNRRIRTGPCRRYRRPRGDGFSYHPYQIRERPNQSTRNPNLAKLGDLRRFFRVLDRAAGKRYGLYITEYGYETNPPDRRFGVSLATQARYLQWSSYIIWATPRVKMVIQYLWRDDPPGPGGQVTGFQTGLKFSDNRDKPSLAVFQHPIHAQGRRLLWGQVRPGGRSRVTILRSLRGGPFQRFASVNTDGRGYWTLRRSLAPNSNYKFQYTALGLAGESDIAHVG